MPVALLPLLAIAATCAASEPLAPETAAFVRQKVQPLLAARCSKCHGLPEEREEEEPAGGLLLANRETALAGGETGPALVPGKPGESLLIDAIHWRDMEMPPASKLPAGEIAILTRWVELGAPWPAGDTPGGIPIQATKKKPFPLAARRAEHWCWQPLADPAVPAVANPAWPRTAIDHFIAAGHEKHKLQVAADAPRETLIRRMSFALTGLPPTPEQLETFVNDPANDDVAIAALADRLLASPHFGERWGRHWLDLMRYAESRGHEYDYLTPNPWHYRDYVIRALNSDLPFDQFFVEHVAGDLLTEPRTRGPQQSNESILATGFWYLGDWIHSPTDIRADEMDRVDNQLDVFGRAFLGLTIACSRCHDHKFDAISAADYYALAGYLQSASYRQVRFETMQHNGRVAEKLWQLRGATRSRLDQLWRNTVGQVPQERQAERIAQNLQQAAAAMRAADLNGSDLPTADQKLKPWVRELHAGRENPQHPLHALADSITQPHAPQNAVPHWEEMVAAYREAAAQRQQSASQSSLLCDYENLPSAAWRQDGHAFGPGPIQAGEMQIAGDLDNPQLRVATVTGAQHDVRWPALRLTAGTQTDPGFLEDLKRSGRTLKTETFPIDGPLHYLVRGKGRLQIVVASHRMIKGPLHEKLIRSFDTGGTWKWVTADLTRYRGERAHIELVPDPGVSCQLRQVAGGPQPPAPATPAESAALWIASQGDPASLTELVALHARGLARALQGQQMQPEKQDRRARGRAALVDWAVQQPHLLPEFSTASNVALRDHAAAEKNLLAEVARKSSTALAIWDLDSEDEHLLIRGSSKTPGKIIPRRNLEALGGRGPTAGTSGSGRLALANDLIDPQRNPLLSRVIVNRVWHHLFGRGIVRSVDNLGVLGDPPSHPQLLDYLARRFVAEGWSLKTLIHQIVTSRTYRLASLPAEAPSVTRDPDNIQLAHMPVRRLEGEAIRDAILSISGRLDPQLGGRSVPIHLTKFVSGRGRPKSGPLDGAGRRSIYLAVRRNFLHPMMLVFDTPIPFNPVGRRNVSNVPAQPLAMMNDPFVADQAKLWAKRVLKENLPLEERIDFMYRTAFGRSVRAEEREQGLVFLQAQAEAYGLPVEIWENDPQVWGDYAHVLLNTKEFIYLQ